MKSRKLRWLAASGLLLAGAAWALDRSGLLLRALEPTLREQASKATQGRLEWASLDGGLFGSARLRQLRLHAWPLPGGQLDVDASTLTLKISLWDLLIARKPPLESLRRVELAGARIAWSSQASTSASPAQVPVRADFDASRWVKSLQWPPVGIRLSDTRLLWIDAQGQTLLALEKLRLGLDLSLAQGLGHIWAAARDPQGGSFDLSANIRPQLGQLQGVLNLERVALPAWAAAKLAQAGVQQEALSAQASVAFVNAEGSSQATWGGLRLHGWLRAKAKAWQGHFTEPELWLRWDGRQAQELSLKARAWGGKLALAASGGMDESWPFTLEGKGLSPAGQSFESLSASGQAQPLSRTVELASFYLGGREGGITAQGRMDFSGPRPWLDLAMSMQGLALNLPQALLLSGTAQIQGDPARPQLKAALAAPMLRIGSLRLDQPRLSLDLAGGAGLLSASASTQLLGSMAAHGRLALSGTALALDDLALSVDGKAWAKAWARLDRDPDKAQQAGAELDNLEFAALARAAELPLDLQGQLKGRLSWARQLGHREWKASLEGPALSTRAGKSFSLFAKASGLDEGVKLEKLDLAQGQFQAKGDWAQGQGITGKFKDADLSLWASALRAPWLAEAGRFDGALSAAPASGGPRVVLELSASRIQGMASGAESLELKAEAHGHQVELSRLDGLQAEGGSLKASALWNPDDGMAEAGFKLSQWKVKGQAWDGEGKLQGGGGLLKRLLGAKRSSPGAPMQGEASWRHWKVAGQAVPDLNARWEWSPSAWALRDLNWDAGLRATYSSSSSSAKAWVRASRLDGAVLARLLDGKHQAPEQGLDAELFYEREEGRAKLRLKAEDSSIEGQLARDESQRWQGQLDIKGLGWKRVAEWLAWAGQDLPRDLAQRLDASLSIDSSAAWPLGLTLTARSLKAGALLGDLSALARIKKNSLELGPSSLGREGAYLQFEGGGLQWGADEAKAGLAWAADSYELPGFKFKGKGKASWQGKAKAGKARVDWAELAVNQWASKGGWLEAQYSPDLLFLVGADPESNLHAKLRRRDGRLEPDDVTWKGSHGAELSWQSDAEEPGREWVDLKALSLEQLALGLGWGKGLSGRLSGHGALRRQSGKWEGQGSLRVEKGRVAGLGFDLASGNLEASHGRLVLDPQSQPFTISSAKTLKAELRGSLPLVRTNSREEIDVRVAFPLFDLAALAGSSAVDAAAGTVNASLRVRGTLASPEWNGRVELSRGLLAFRRLLAPLEDVHISAVIDKGHVQLLRADAQVGEEGQQLLIGHGPRGEDALVLDGLGVSQFNLALSSGKRGIRLKGDADYDFINGICHPELFLQGDGEKPEIKGRLKLEKATVTYPPRRRNPPDPSKDDFLSRAEWDLLVESGDSVRYTGVGSNLEIQAENPGLRIYGPGKELALAGRVAAKRGRLSYLLTEFDLDPDRSSSVEFRGDLAPNFDLWGVRTVRPDTGGEVVVRMHLSGPLDQIRVVLSSDDSSLSEAQMASYVGLGVDLTNQDVSAQVAVALIGKAGLNAVFGSLKRNRALDDISLRMPGLARALAQSGTSTAQAQGLSGTGRSIVELVMVKNFGIFVVKATTGTRESKTGEGQELVVKGGLEVPVSKHTKFEVETGSDENRVGVRSQSNLENYDPKRRKRELDLQKVLDREARKASPTPTPLPTEPPSPEKP